jgi:hypothetical protein
MEAYWVTRTGAYLLRSLEQGSEATVAPPLYKGGPGGVRSTLTGCLQDRRETEVGGGEWFREVSRQTFVPPLPPLIKGGNSCRGAPLFLFICNAFEQLPLRGAVLDGHHVDGCGQCVQ